MVTIARMSPVIEGAGVELSYVEAGSGPSVVLVHGAADDAAGWAGVQAALAPRARVIAYDRRGYGGSGAPEPYEATSVAEQTEDAAALIRALAPAPAIAPGTDIGALIVLDLLLRHRDLVAGAVLAAPALYALVPAATEALSAQRVALEAALRKGGPAGAVEAYLGGAPAARIARARTRPRAFFADWGGMATLSVTRRELRALDVPAVLLDGPEPGAPAALASARLAELLPRAQRRAGDDVAAAVAVLLPAA